MKKKQLKKKIKALENYMMWLEQVPTFEGLISPSLRDQLCKAKEKLK